MSQDIRRGRWLQLRGRAKRAWAWFTGNEAFASEGHADIVAGVLQESYGTAKSRTAREIERGVDAIATIAKRTARTLDH